LSVYLLKLLSILICILKSSINFLDFKHFSKSGIFVIKHKNLVCKTYRLKNIIMKILSALLLFLFFQSSFATTYYISTKGSDKTGNGSIGNPWQSLYQATTVVTKAGDIIHVNAGIYTEIIRCTLAPGVSIEGEGAASIIQSTLTEPFVAIIIARSDEGTDGNQHISNIKLDGSKRTTSWAIEIRGRKNVSIHDCIIADFEESGIIWGGRNDNEPEPPAIYATGNTFYNNILTNCAKYSDFGRGCLAIGGQEGMLIYNNTISQTGRKKGTNGWPIKYCNDGFLKGLKIYNNTITKQAFDGTSWDFALELFNVSGLEIYNNTIIGSIDLNHQKKGNYPYTIYIHNNIIGPLTMQHKLENGIVLEYDTETGIIEKNRFRNLGVLIYFTPRTGSVISNIVIKDNLADNIGIADGSHQGFAVRFGSVGKNNYAIENFFVYNNKFIANPLQKPYWGLAFLDAAKANNIQIKNNTIKGFSAACISADPAFAIDTMIIENNVLSGNGYANQSSFSFGVPQYYMCKNNTKTDGYVLTVANIKMNIIRPLYYGLKNTSILEFIALFAGIISFWFGRKENIYIFPMGLINAFIYLAISFEQGIYGSAVMNFYYIVMGIYGWMLWSKRDKKKHRVIRITDSTKKEGLAQLVFFLAFFITTFIAISYFKRDFTPGSIPWADALASAASFTGMWLMTKKKTESWYWWIAANVVSIQLYFSKNYILTGFYFTALLLMSVWGLYDWKRKKRVKRKIKN
jgi:nicotinamide mononucleotide transporter